MTFDVKNVVSMTEANQNFSKAVKVVDNTGKAVIFKNNKPKYLLLDINSTPLADLTENEMIDIVAKRILAKYKPAFMELAK